MPATNLNGPRNLSEAIDRLEQVTQNKSEEIRHILGKDYSDLKRALDELKPHLTEISSKFTDQVSQTKKSVEAKVQDHPWTTLAVAGLIGLFFGWILGFGRRHD